MTSTKVIVLLAVVIFLTGMIAGSGLGIVYGKNANQVVMEQKVTELERELDTVNGNYLTLVREYNRLLTLVNMPPPVAETAASVPAAPVLVEPQPEAEEASVQDISPAAEAPPLADFSADPVEGPPGTEIHFTDESTGTITSWLWDFGDGVTSTEQDPTHVYQGDDPSQEFFTITLTVTGPDGSDTIMKENYIWISEACTC